MHKIQKNTITNESAWKKKKEKTEEKGKEKTEKRNTRGGT